MGVSKSVYFDWPEVDSVADLTQPCAGCGVGDGFVTVEEESAGGVLFPLIKGSNGAWIEGKGADGCGGFWCGDDGVTMGIDAECLADGDAAVVEVGPFEGKYFAAPHAGVCEQAEEWIDLFAGIFFAGVEKGVEFGFCPEWTILLNGWHFTRDGDVIGWVGGEVFFAHAVFQQALDVVIHGFVVAVGAVPDVYLTLDCLGVDGLEAQVAEGWENVDPEEFFCFFGGAWLYIKYVLLVPIVIEFLEGNGFAEVGGTFFALGDGDAGFVGPGVGFFLCLKSAFGNVALFAGFRIYAGIDGGAVEGAFLGGVLADGCHNDRLLLYP